MASRYHGLARHLAAQPGPTQTMTFAEVAATTYGRSLPPSAYAARSFWSNSAAHSHARHGWLAAGWRIASVDLGRQRVTFRKG